MTPKTNFNPNIERTCCFAGPAPDCFPWRWGDHGQYIMPLMARLESEIRKAIENGYRHFISCMSEGVGRYAARIVLKIKREQPDFGITLEAAILCSGQPDRWSETKKAEYVEMLALADKQTTIGKEWSVENNQKLINYMVDNAGLLIAVSSFGFGNTQLTIWRAEEKNIELAVIDPMEFYSGKNKLQRRKEIPKSHYYKMYFAKNRKKKKLFIQYAEKGSQMDKQRAMYLLLQLYVDNCGISISLRTVAWDACWAIFNKHEKEISFETDSFFDVGFLNKINPNYTEEINERYDIIPLNGYDEYLEICMMIMEENDDETNNAVCYGISLLFDTLKK